MMYMEQFEDRLIKKDFDRHQIINKAVKAVNDIVLEDAEPEEVDFLIFKIGLRLLESTMHRLRTDVIKKDLTDLGS